MQTLCEYLHLGLLRLCTLRDAVTDKVPSVINPAGYCALKTCCMHQSANMQDALVVAECMGHTDGCCCEGCSEALYSPPISGARVYTCTWFYSTVVARGGCGSCRRVCKLSLIGETHIHWAVLPARRVYIVRREWLPHPPPLIWEHLVVTVMIFEAEKPIKFELW